MNKLKVGIRALLVLMMTVATVSCAFLSKANDQVQDACHSGLLNLPEVIEEAKIRNVSVGALVDLFCGLSDVAAVFDSKVKKTTGGGRAALTPQEQALSLLRAKGEIK